MIDAANLHGNLFVLPGSPWFPGFPGDSLRASAEDLEEHDLWGAVEMNQELSSKVAKAKAKAKAEPKKKGPKEAKARVTSTCLEDFEPAFFGRKEVLTSSHRPTVIFVVVDCCGVMLFGSLSALLAWVYWEGEI